MAVEIITKTKELSFDQKEEEALSFVRETIKKHDLPRYVSFSGGKDSIVTAHIVRRVDPNIKMIFNDTTIEFPDLINYVQSLIREGWNIEIIKPTVTFEEGLKKFGPPGRRRRWCCDVIKKASLWKNSRRFNNQEGTLSFLGIRSEESYRRSRYKRLASFPIRGPFNPKRTRAVHAYPLLYFSKKDIWSYIKKHGLPYCKLYDKGLTRLGCMFCPFADDESNQALTDLYPEKKKAWESYLKNYAKDNGLDESWAEGPWRENYGISKRIVAGTKEVVATRIVRYRFQEPLSPQQKNFFVPFQKHPNVKIKFFPGNKTMLVSQPKWAGFQVLPRVEVQILKALNCLNCEWCLIVCQHIGTKENKIHIEDSCTGCLKCTYKTSCTILRWGGNINTLRNLGTAQWGRKKTEIY